MSTVSVAFLVRWYNLPPLIPLQLSSTDNAPPSSATDSPTDNNYDYDDEYHYLEACRLKLQTCGSSLSNVHGTPQNDMLAAKPRRLKLNGDVC